MQVRVNGELRSIVSMTVAGLLRELEAPETGVAVAVNGTVVPRSERETRVLRPNDDIEVLRAVGGG
jgi:sulfur carrier protein